tara:strand:+ start:9899 stop:10102 length:204 start_codon:yes stop_codon:yes gene_type:complete
LIEYNALEKYALDKYRLKVKVRKIVKKYIVEAPRYKKEDIIKILSETHPSWKSLELKPLEREGDKND